MPWPPYARIRKFSACVFTPPRTHPPTHLLPAPGVRDQVLIRGDPGEVVTVTFLTANNELLAAACTLGSSQSTRAVATASGAACIPV